ncbi:hypothetical protein H6G27_24800 [Nostoc linckia FACHB-104]|nr:hypothetical protein [Nostoc linckia FACHB-104]
MTHAKYTQQELYHYNLPRLKRIAADLGVKPTGDKRASNTWSNAIITHQSAELQEVDEQAIAQAELDQYIADQAETIAPQLTTVEINCYHYEVYALKQLVAYIAYDYDEFVTQPWVVMVNGEEKFRHTTVARCQRFIEWHHQDGTLNAQIETEVPEAPTILEISFYDQEAFVGDELVASISYDHGNYQNLYWRVMINGQEIFRDISPARCHSYIKQQYQQSKLPLQEQLEPEEPWATGNEIMAEIFSACETYGFEMLDDGIYQNDVKLGEVGCTDGRWWVVRAAQDNQRIPCNSASDAVQLLSESTSDEFLGYRLLEHLSPREWRSLLSGAAQGQKLVTA